MTGPETAETIMERMKEFGTVEQARKNRVRVRTRASRLPDAIRIARAVLGYDRLISISTADTGTVFELLYHLFGPDRIVLTLVVEVPRENPVTLSLSDLLPPAAVYERQIHDLFGIRFEGHPNLKKIILNEDWPEGEYPLRKDWKPQPGVFYGGIRKEGS